MEDAFKRFQAPTSPFPMGMRVDHAAGSYIYDADGRCYLDFVAGVSALPLGHGHPAIKKAVADQMDRYAHVMVYGEFEQAPAVKLCKRLAEIMPAGLDMTYLVNSGTEAVEAAMKLVRRVTGRTKIIAMKKAYHGNTLGSLSLMDYEERKAPFRPLLPEIHHIQFNDLDDLETIDHNTAAVIAESIQGGAGFIVPSIEWAQKLRAKCDEVGALLILDEIQPGLGRTGTWFYFEQLSIAPDIVVTGKGLGGGFPIGALTAREEHLSLLAKDPILGHITTFGGNPVIASAALANLNELAAGCYMDKMSEKEARFRESLKHPLIKEVRGKGLMLALILESPETAHSLVMNCYRKGLILFFLLYEKRAVRITPPLTISAAEIDQGCQIILQELDRLQ